MTRPDTTCHKMVAHPQGGFSSDAPCGEKSPAWMAEDWEVVTCPRCLALHTIEQGNVSVVRDPNFDDHELCEENRLYVVIDFNSQPTLEYMRALPRVIDDVLGSFEHRALGGPDMDVEPIRVQVSEKP